MDNISSNIHQLPYTGKDSKPFGKVEISNVTSQAPQDVFIKNTETNDLKEWTILAYLNGNDRAIEKDVLNAFLFMEEASSPEHFNIVSQLGRAPQKLVHPNSSPDCYDKVDGDWDGVRRYEIRKGQLDRHWGLSVWTSMGKHDGKIDSKLVKDLGKVDMSNPEVLRDFLEWGIKNYPAKHYAVVLAGHGNGFLGTLPDFQSHNKDMPLGQLADIFAQTKEKTGIKPDVLIMDACLMAQAEAAYQLKDSAHILVGSENINMDCLAYQDFFNMLNERKERKESISAEILANDMISACAKHEDNIPTISAIDLTHINKLGDALSMLANALLETDTPETVIREIINKTQRFLPEGIHTKPLSDYRDLYSFTANLKNSAKVKDRKVKDAAEQLMELIKSRFVIGEHHKSSSFDSNDIHGLSIYLPSDGFPKENDYGRVISTWNVKEIKPTYLSLSLVQKSGWNRVIEKFAGPSNPLPPSNNFF